MSGIRRVIPLLDRVLVRRVEAKAQTAGGILLPDSAVSKVNEGTVVAVGKGARKADGGYHEPTVKQGDRVLLPEYGGQTIKVNDEDLTLFRDEDILGILEN